MANAAEQQVYWTKALYDLTFLEIGALVLTLIATAAAAIAAFIAAKAAREAVELTAATTKHELRAYVGVNIDVVDGPYGKFKLRLVNVGQTPAKKVRVGSAVSCPVPTFVGTQVHHNPVFPEIEADDTDAPKAVIFPTQNHFVRAELDDEPVEKDQAELIRAGMLKFYIHGVVVYDDIFGDEWWTKFRAEYGGPDCVREKTVRLCPEGNDAT